MPEESNIESSAPEYHVEGIVPLSAMVIKYKEDGIDKEDLFFFSPDTPALIPGFESGGPKDPKAFSQAFIEGFNRVIEDQNSKIVRPAGPIIAGPQGQQIIQP